MTARRRRSRAGRPVFLLVAALTLGLGLAPVVGQTGHPGLVAWVPAARAADPASTTGPAEAPSASTEPAGDPRVPSGGPGFVGEPALAAGIVAAVGIGAVLLTLVYVRLTPGRGDS